jgi:beta-glucosidase
MGGVFRFPADFAWGVATSAFQVEGAVRDDGRGESIWDRFCARPGAVHDGQTAEVACDHYRRWRQDVDLMKTLGVGAYRFSIAWPRVLPRGRGSVNARGLDFYDALVDRLLEAGVAPFVTLYHWDLPQALQDEGGWVNRGTAHAFADYADIVSRRLGDRVKHWITHNEPWCAAFLGHQAGVHAPGVREWPAALAASHHLLLSHGLAVPLIRQNSRGAEVGITLNFTPATPASPSLADRQAARHADGYGHRWFLDPLVGRGYPHDMVTAWRWDGCAPGSESTVVRVDDLSFIAAPIDFLGVNYYTRQIVRNEELVETENMPRRVFEAPEESRTTMGWEVYPVGLRDLLLRLRVEYGVDRLYVTENGASFIDVRQADGRFDDPRRRAYIHDHLRAVWEAIQAGVPVAGYFAWSLFDNFEWERGYTQWFGLVHVDFATQERVPKESAGFYRDVATTNELRTPLDATGTRR